MKNTHSDIESDKVDIPEITPATDLWKSWWQLRDSASRNALFIYYSSWLRKVTGNLMLRYHYPLAEWGDYIHFASIGLFSAIEKYDQSLNNNFENYAYLCVKGQILNGLSNYTSESKKNTNNYNERLEEYDDEIDSFTSVVNSVVGLALGYFLESGVYDENIYENDPLHIYQSEQESNLLIDFVNQLPEREKFIIISHYLHHISFKEIAELTSLSSVRVSQLHHQGLKRLRKFYEASMVDL